MPASSSQLLNVARRAGKRASQICRAVLDGTPMSLEKGDKSPVTLADYGCQAVILKEISAVFPEHRIVAEEGSVHLKETAGEEGAQRIVKLVSDNLGVPVSFDQVCRWIDYQGNEGAEFTWSIDPIDGTKGFLRREQYAVAIGILKNGVPYAGVLACPNLPVDLNQPDGPRGVLYVAAQGKGTTRVPIDGGEELSVTTNATDLSSCRVLGSVESAHGDPALAVAMMKHAGMGGGFVRYDSQVKYGILADGNAEVYVRPRSRPDYRENIWDHVAGVIVAQEAGGKVTDIDGKPLDFSLGNKLVENRGVLATASVKIHAAAVAAIRAAEAAVEA